MPVIMQAAGTENIFDVVSKNPKEAMLEIAQAPAEAIALVTSPATWRKLRDQLARFDLARVIVESSDNPLLPNERLMQIYATDRRGLSRTLIRAIQTVQKERAHSRGL